MKDTFLDCDMLKKFWNFKKCWYSLTANERKVIRKNRRFEGLGNGKTCVIVGAGPMSGKEISPDYAIVSLNNAGLMSIKNIPVSYIVMLDSIYFANTQFQYKDYQITSKTMPSNHFGMMTL